MKEAYYMIWIITQLVFILIGCDSEKKPDSYVIKFIDGDIKVDGILNDPEWASADSIDGLYAPWDSIGKDKTKIKLFHSSLYFYVEDQTLITYDFVEELTVAKGGRVELFFSATPNLSQYYCIEMDPLGNILDYSAQYYRKFNEDWDFNQTIVASQLRPEGYIVEGCISIKELERLGIKGSFYLGIFQADFKSNRLDDVVWFTWVTPDSDDPDFHIPSAFRKCIFENP